FALGASAASETTVLHYDGVSWVEQANGIVAGALWGSGPPDVFAVGGVAGAGSIVHYDGTSWTTQPHDAGTTLLGVGVSGPTDAFAVGDGGTILHYDGTTWVTQQGGAPSFLRGIWGSGASDVFAVGGGPAGGILAGLIVAHYDGTSWNASELTPGAVVNSGAL